MALSDLRLNQISRPIAAANKVTNPKPIIRAFANSVADPSDGFNHSKLIAKIKTTVMVSYKRSIMMVTNAAAGRTRGSRIGKTTGRTTSPARPTNSTVPKPTVVAIQTSRRLDFVRGARKACHRMARKR